MLFLCIECGNAASNFVPIRLPHGVSVELPGNWRIASTNQRITLDTWLQAKMELAGFAYESSDLAFAANYYDDADETAGIFNIRYYPDSDVTQADARTVDGVGTKELDSVLQQTIVPGIEMAGNRLLAWVGTTKHTLNGSTAFISEYSRSSRQSVGGFRVRLVRIFNGEKSFTITLSYRENEEFFLRPICDRIIQSIRME